MRANKTVPMVVGFCVGVGGSYVALFTSGLIFLWVLIAQGIAPENVYAQAYQSTPYLIYAHILGFVTTAPGGYWTARLSSDGTLWQVIFAGSLMTIFAFVQLAIPYELPIPWWSQIASVVTPIPAFVAGMYLWKHRA